MFMAILCSDIYYIDIIGYYAHICVVSLRALAKVEFSIACEWVDDTKSS